MDKNIENIIYKDINSLISAEYNPRQLNKEQYNNIKDSLKRFGFVDPVIINKNKDRKNIIIGGHQRVKVAKDLKINKVPCVELDLDIDKEKELNIRLNKNVGEWDFDILADLFNIDELIEWGFKEEELVGFDIEEEKEGLTDDDDIPEDVEPVCKLGDIWQLGNHRLLCGDSTKKENIDILLDGNKAELLHADPPYGMGKEKEGVLNDNLYKEKLDTFQMEWYKSFRSYLTDNASVYIWGNAENLWRLWYNASLKDYERLTFRNEIVWDKGHGLGMSSEKHRQYPTTSERCLFFMLGEQGFNNNSDNYWAGWDYIVHYLKEEKEKSKLSIKDFKKIAGHSINSGCHWFDKSQWSIPTKETYESWQNYCNENRIDAFKKEYDDLKKEYDDTRAYFNNLHDNMTDVWKYNRVSGEERFGHATPKPVEMMERIIKSSSKKKVIEPFLGSGSTLIACEKTNRTCYGMELDEKYCDVIINRWEQFTGNKAELINEKRK
jgi:DNA modification methylase